MSGGIVGFIKKSYFRYTCQTGIYVLNTTETVIIHSFFLIMWLLVLRYASSFMGEAFGYFSN